MKPREICFIVQGRIFPYTRMTQRGKWMGRAKEYLAWKESYAWKLRNVYVGGQPKFPILWGMDYWGASRRGDWDNLKKAVQDAMMHAGILPNDGLKYVYGDLAGQFQGVDKANPRAEIRMTEKS